MFSACVDYMRLLTVISPHLKKTSTFLVVMVEVELHLSVLDCTSAVWIVEV